MSDLADRARLAASMNGMQFGGARDLYEVLGYSRDIKPCEYVDTYRRNGIAYRIVNAFPEASWRGTPTITDAGATFDKAFESFAQRNKLWHYCQRVDKLSGLGRYSILVFGLNDNIDMALPVARATDVLWIKPITEANAPVGRWEQDPLSPRFGMPLMYRVTVGSGKESDTASPNKTFEVHYSRVIHVAEGLDEDDIYGEPRLRSIWNRLQDMDKIVGGSAEMFWQGARGGLKFTADDDAQLSADDIAKLKEDAELYQHELRRMLATKGGSWETIASQAPDPRGNFDTCMDEIAGATGIPKRILLGNEAGDLASSTDENSWHSRISERRDDFVSPCIVRAVIDLLVMVGVLPAPASVMYGIEWSTTEHVDPVKQAAYAQGISTALSTYTSAIGAELIVPVEEFRSLVLGLKPEPEGGFPIEPEATPVTTPPPLATNRRKYRAIRWS